MARIGGVESAGPSDFSRLHRGRRMPIQFHADLAQQIYSGLALGLFAHMAMLRDGDDFSIRQMQRTHKEGRDAWSGALAELLELGLVARVRWSDARGQWRTRYYLAQDHAFDVDDIAFIREVHGAGCLIECSPKLSNTPIQVSSRVSKRPRKDRPVVEGCSGSVDNEAALQRDAASAAVAPTNAIAATGTPTNAIAATGMTSTDTSTSLTGGVAAIAGTEEESNEVTSLPPYPPTRSQPGPEPAAPQQGGREAAAALHPSTQQVMTAVKKTWPILTRTARHQITRIVSQRLTEGFPPSLLQRVLCENTDGVKMPAQLLIHRLGDLDTPPATQAPAQPWCGVCDHGWVSHDDGQTVHHCPACHQGPTTAVDKACPQCQELFVTHAANHTRVDWCGACDPSSRTINGTSCTACHPTLTCESLA